MNRLLLTLLGLFVLPCVAEAQRGRSGKVAKSKKIVEPARQTLPALGRGKTPAKSQKLTVPLGAADSSKRVRLPAIIQDRLDQGALTRDEAEALVRQLVNPAAFAEPSDLKALQSSTLESDEALLGLVLELAEGAGLQRLDPQDGSGSQAPLDSSLLTTWYTGLDSDGSESTTFQEFRLATRFGLQSFLWLDMNKDGVVVFPEFAWRVMGIAESEGFAVHPDILQSVTAEISETEEPAKSVGSLSAAERAKAMLVIARAQDQLSRGADPYAEVRDHLADVTQTVQSSSRARPGTRKLSREQRVALADEVAASLYPLPAERGSQGWQVARKKAKEQADGE